ncbi:MAG TPA: pyridoxine 5'-phosphate synthase [Saprospiraceae bacterium]|nr:pyridoxine 5'-phosphate synthase [Saprospiraceae bacterium]
MPEKIKLSVNINKIALIRNSRGGNYPDLIQVAKDCEAYGADGITIHPRPDERHIRYNDIPALKENIATELNVEGNPTDRFMYEVLNHKPHQCTLVPDSPDALTSDKGWDTLKEKTFLSDIIKSLKEAGIRVSVFIDPMPEMVEGAFDLGADRVELYTGAFAESFKKSPALAVENHIKSAERARAVGIGLNAGHDLNLDNLRYYSELVPGLLEVSIGHALISDALYYGLANVISMYQNQLKIWEK